MEKSINLSSKIAGLLTEQGKRKEELAAYLGVSPQSLGNKFSRNSWTAKDLTAIADFLDLKLAFVGIDLSVRVITTEDAKR